MGKRTTTEKFRIKAIRVHGDKYDYSKVNYLNSRSKVIIICKKHGEFQQNPYNHIQGRGCSKCQYIKMSSKFSHTTEKFINKANKVHNNGYAYKNLAYKNAKTKVTITCKEHGIFKQTPDSHLQGRGCPKCVYLGGWNYTEWSLAAQKSNNFDSFKVYIIKCWNENEEFYKIGKTYLSLNKRFTGKRDMPYNYETVEIFEGKSEEMSKLEKQLQKENKEFKYIPKIKFNGYSECFTKNQSI